MTKKSRTPFISFNVDGKTHAFEMPADMKGIPWGEIRDLIMQELVRQFSKGDVRLEVRHFCTKCGKEKVLDVIALNKSKLMRHIEESVGKGDLAKERASECLDVSTDCALNGIRRHFFPPD